MRRGRGPAIEAAAIETAAGDQLTAHDMGTDDHDTTDRSTSGSRQEGGRAGIRLAGESVAAMREVEIDQGVAAWRGHGVDIEAEGELHQ